LNLSKNSGDKLEEKFFCNSEIIHENEILKLKLSQIEVQLKLSEKINQQKNKKIMELDSEILTLKTEISN
jgi:hypothetical protein